MILFYSNWKSQESINALNKVGAACIKSNK